MRKNTALFTVLPAISLLAVALSSCGRDRAAAKAPKERSGRGSRGGHNEQGGPAAAEEDTEGEGRIEKGETYDGDRLAAVAFDPTPRGGRDRRLIYGADGAARLEVDEKGDG